MPRKTKENSTQKIEQETITKKTTNPTKKSTTTKKSSSQNTTVKKKTVTSTSKTKVEPKTTSTKKGIPSKKSSSKNTTTKNSTTTRKKTTTKKTTTKRSTVSDKKGEIVEYYDLPYRYNQTIVKVLAQTPTNLFIYWDISDKDRKNFEQQYGENFFETTRPILIIHNTTLGYSFEVEINDFANSWYLSVSDSKCDYTIELGRRPIAQTEKLNTIDYIYITTSNKIESPNDKILFDKNQKMIYFKNVKTQQLTEKALSSMSFIQNNMGNINHIYNLYRAIYQDNNIEEIFDLANPSSRNPSSGSFSSKF